MQHTKRSTSRTRTHLLTFAALTLMVAPAAASSQLAGPMVVGMQQQQQEPGAGTEAKKCIDQAWADYNICLTEASSRWGRTLCDLAFEADVIWCGAVYKKRLETGT